MFILLHPIHACFFFIFIFYFCLEIRLNVPWIISQSITLWPNQSHDFKGCTLHFHSMVRSALHYFVFSRRFYTECDGSKSLISIRSKPVEVRGIWGHLCLSVIKGCMLQPHQHFASNLKSWILLSQIACHLKHYSRTVLQDKIY